MNNRKKKLIKHSISILFFALFTFFSITKDASAATVSKVTDSKITSVKQPYILISNKISDITEGKTYQFTAKSVGLESTDIVWWVSNKELASINYYTGYFIAKNPGKIKVTAKDRKSGKISACYVDIGLADENKDEVPLNKIIIWKDAQIETAARGSLGKYKGPVTMGEVNSITELLVENTKDAWGSHCMDSLDDLKYFKNLKILKFNDIGLSVIEDISPILQSKNLEVLSITSVSDRLEKLNVLTNLKELEITISKKDEKNLTFLYDMPSLEKLSISGSSIKSLKGIEKLPHLKELNIISMPELNDISALKNLSNLQKLSIFTALSNEKLKDFSVISKINNLKELYLHTDYIEKFNFLQGCNKLEELNIVTSEIQDVTVFSTLPKLRAIKLSSYKESEFKGFEQLTQIQTLEFTNHLIKDINFLSQCTGLKNLYLSTFQLNDISGISTLTNIEKLRVNSTEITDISPFTKLKALKECVLSVNTDNLEPLSYLNNIETLEISGHNFLSIEPLQQLKKLKNLKILNSNLENIKPLDSLINLETLSLECPNITSIEPIKKLTKLQELAISCNKLEALNALSNLKNLKSLCLDIKDLPCMKELESLNNLEGLDIADIKVDELEHLRKLSSLKQLKIWTNNIISDASFINELNKLESLYIGYQVSNLSFLENNFSLMKVYVHAPNLKDYTLLDNADFEECTVYTNLKTIVIRNGVTDMIYHLE
ncbi:leucine-rich repeat domain-containing protein [Lachnoclostridium phytofermentans]|uniref:BIG2 domain-containing protein n=1 Tax=Lachnoclostridium phytofermentans (strain ATCC 700394 / DSM 18823 / ISDg) TaxID=357809 RepID=A9KRU0_LACP7|nr:leucine-rich repeat domain-containing protein [Lachnoclostridium phytofermentans]ABX43584.1 hypothetical protein Cphy_3230 [Lachnoclostridium phytofermentans ISDg]